MTEGHERCISKEQFQRLQELHDNQKKLIASLKERIQDLETELDNALEDMGKKRLM
jgi:hypothetical protein